MGWCNVDPRTYVSSYGTFQPYAAFDGSGGFNSYEDYVAAHTAWQEGSVAPDRWATVTSSQMILVAPW